MRTSKIPKWPSWSGKVYPSASGFGCSRQLPLNKIFDPSTPSMIKVDDGEKKKKEKRKETRLRSKVLSLEKNLKINLSLNKFWVQKKWSKKYCVGKKFWVKEILGPKKFGTVKILCPEHILGQNKF